jgi:putative drug exporter of the RND superfamily
MQIFGAIGSFAVRFRWLVLLGWVAAAVVIPRALPSLSSVTQASNASFLPASAPSEHALQLATLAGESNATPVQVVAATTRAGLFGPR